MNRRNASRLQEQPTIHPNERAKEMPVLATGAAVAVAAGASRERARRAPETRGWKREPQGFWWKRNHHEPDEQTARTRQQLLALYFADEEDGDPDGVTT